jgi:deoxyribodipyrimidine photo-lyase
MDDLHLLAEDPRVTVRRAGPPDPAGSCVVYWMQRAQRGIDNPALELTVEAANTLGKPAVVFFAPVPFYPRANLRHYRFLADGIPDIAEALQERNIGFELRRFPDHSLLKFCAEVKPALVVGDENPLRETEGWRCRAAQKLNVPLWTVDADVIVPSRLLEKEQYAAHIIRPRLQSQLDRFLVPPRNTCARVPWHRPISGLPLDLALDITEGWPLDTSAGPVSTFRGGSKEALRRLQDFIAHGLPGYSNSRNRPETSGTSRLSPYLHFGHISPVTVALAAQRADVPAADKEAFLNQIVVWRELAVNLVRFNPNYDNFNCAEPWAHRTIVKHARDDRPVLYNNSQMEHAETHDPLWNAAQLQMVSLGWMHNYMRMYWAKKILEWSPSAELAYQVAVELNDRYQLDGRDPNGYAGIAWSIVGKFDRPWFERPIFGQIRYMSGASTGRKFDSRRYIQQVQKGLFD